MGCCEKTKEDKAREARWRAEEDLRTMSESAAIKRDKQRYQAVVKLAKEKLASLDGAVGTKGKK